MYNIQYSKCNCSRYGMVYGCMPALMTFQPSKNLNSATTKQELDPYPTGQTFSPHRDSNSTDTHTCYASRTQCNIQTGTKHIIYNCTDHNFTRICRFDGNTRPRSDIKSESVMNSINVQAMILACLPGSAF